MLGGHRSQYALREGWPPISSDQMMQNMSEGEIFLLLRGNTPRLTQDQADGGDPGDGDDGYGGGGGGPPNPPNPPNKPDGGKGKKMPKDNKPKGGSGRPDGGDGGDDPDPNEDDDDEKFRRRMIKFLGGFVDPKMDDKPEVKEADAIKILALPWPKPIATGESRLVRQLLQHPLIRIMLSKG